MFIECLLDRKYKRDANDQVQVTEKAKIETSFLYAFLSFQIEVTMTVKSK